MRKIHVDIVSDLVCPWCFVGKRRFEAAVQEFGPKLGLEFEVRWRPFQLNPNASKAGVNKMEMYEQKFGAARTKQMIPMMRQTGEACTPPIRFSYGGMTANSLDGHRLMELAWEQGGARLQNAVQEKLFSAYFEQEKNIGSHDVLVEAAAAAGMDAMRVQQFLATDEKAAEVKAEIREFVSKYRISGVPFFIIGSAARVSGAQDMAAFLEIFEEL